MAVAFYASISPHCSESTKLGEPTTIFVVLLHMLVAIGILLFSSVPPIAWVHVWGERPNHFVSVLHRPFRGAVRKLFDVLTFPKTASGAPSEDSKWRTEFRNNSSTDHHKCHSGASGIRCSFTPQAEEHHHEPGKIPGTAPSVSGQLVSCYMHSLSRSCM